jgi:tetratricopeptide (TPR) repeat protein
MVICALFAPTIESSKHVDRYPELFEAAEQARIQGDNELAVRLYQEAGSLSEQSSAFDPIALHHMWGVALISLGEFKKASHHLREASSRAGLQRRQKAWAAIDRDMAWLYLAIDAHGMAMTEIDKSLSYITANDIAERGASLGVKARILLARGRVNDALELFGTAAILLQRSSNRHYELHNGLHFATALVEHGSVEELANLDLYFDRVGWLATRYGGKPHRGRWQELVHSIREKKGLENPRT